MNMAISATRSSSTRKKHTPSSSVSLAQSRLAWSRSCIVLTPQLNLNPALEKGIVLHRGVYVAVAGPNLETRAEYRMLRTMGADIVGMSTVPEVIVARHMDMRVLGISIITDSCLPDALEKAKVEDIIATAMGAEPNLTVIIKEVIGCL